MALAPLKKGSFSPDEDDKIVRNWKKFCKVRKDKNADQIHSYKSHAKSVQIV